MAVESLIKSNQPRFLDLKLENLQAVDKIKKTVEKALFHFGERSPLTGITSNMGREEIEVISITSEFHGQLSTHPELINKNAGKKKLNKENLNCMCGFFSKELQRCLDIVGQNSIIYSNHEADHLYITTRVGKEEVIADPTIGQFLLGYNHVFVGTREELGRLVLQYAKNKELSMIDMSINEKSGVDEPNPEDFFRNTWRNSVIHKFNTIKGSTLK